MRAPESTDARTAIRWALDTLRVAAAFIKPGLQSVQILRREAGRTAASSDSPPHPSYATQDVCNYWIILGIALTADALLQSALSWFPLYSVFQTLFYYWLSHDSFRGATLLYRGVIGIYLAEKERSAIQTVMTPSRAISDVVLGIKTALEANAPRIGNDVDK